MALDLSGIPASFPAVLAAEPDGAFSRLEGVGVENLGDGDVLVEVDYSSLNYKDGLALTGAAPVVRSFPMIGGVDLSGRVISSDHPSWRAGDEIVVAGCGLGEDHPGGYCPFARVPGDWGEHLPPGLSLRSAAAIGTAGLTAMLSLMALERNRSSADDLGEGTLLITGASGGVGSLAVLLGARLGYRVTASTGKDGAGEYLRSLGAIEVMGRLGEGDPSRALEPVRYGAAIDTVGGDTLASLVRSMRPNGTVAACGLVGGTSLEVTVHPFILRGISLMGINSVRPPFEDRHRAWQRIGELLEDDDFHAIVRDVSMYQVIDVAPEILAGQIRGRVVVHVREP